MHKFRFASIEKKNLNVFQCRNTKRISRTIRKMSEKVKTQRRLARKKRKGFEDVAVDKEGVMYDSGVFDLPESQPLSKRSRKPGQNYT